MSYILGLDVSTSIIGYTILDSDFSVVEIDHIDLRKIKGLWCKTDSAKIRLNDILEKYKDMVIESMGEEGYDKTKEYNTILIEKPHISDIEFGRVKFFEGEND